MVSVTTNPCMEQTVNVPPLHNHYRRRGEKKKKKRKQNTTKQKEQKWPKRKKNIHALLALNAHPAERMPTLLPFQRGYLHQIIRVLFIFVRNPRRDDLPTSVPPEYCPTAPYPSNPCRGQATSGTTTDEECPQPCSRFLDWASPY